MKPQRVYELQYTLRAKERQCRVYYCKDLILRPAEPHFVFFINVDCWLCARLYAQNISCHCVLIRYYVLYLDYITLPNWHATPPTTRVYIAERLFAILLNCTVCSSINAWAVCVHLHRLARLSSFIYFEDYTQRAALKMYTRCTNKGTQLSWLRCRSSF